MEAVDDLHGRGHLVDGGRQRLGGHVDELPQAELGILVERPGTPEVEAGEEVLVRGWIASVDGENRTAGGHVLADAGDELDHALMFTGQADQLGPIDTEHGPENPPVSMPIDRRQVHGPGGRAEQRGLRGDVLVGGRNLPADGAPRLVGHRGDHPGDLEQAHGGGDVDEEDRDRRPHEGDGDEDGAGRSSRVGDVVEGECRDREREGGQKDPERGLGDRGPDERADHPRGELRAGELETHQGDGEDDPDKGQHRGRHHLQHGVRGTRAGTGSQPPVVREAEQPGAGHQEAGQDTAEDEGHRDRPEPLSHPLRQAEPAMGPVGPDRQRPYGDRRCRDVVHDSHLRAPGVGGHHPRTVRPRRLSGFPSMSRGVSTRCPSWSARARSGACRPSGRASRRRRRCRA